MASETLPQGACRPLTLPPYSKPLEYYDWLRGLRNWLDRCPRATILDWNYIPLEVAGLNRRQIARAFEKMVEEGRIKDFAICCDGIVFNRSPRGRKGVQQ
jgi:23S rRNA A2030 N6-methylase RlmJ